jgi:transposase
MLGAKEELRHMSMSDHKHMPEPVRRLEVFTGRGRRRTWSSEEKAAIVAESYGASETVCAVARRHGLTAQQLFTWRRLGRGRPGAEQPPTFVPAVVEEGPAEQPMAVPVPHRCGPVVQASIELEIDGVVVRVGEGARAATVAAVIRALKASS